MRQSAPVFFNTIVSVLEQVATHGAQWRDVATQADARAARLGGQVEPLAWKASDQARIVDFRGYAYTRTPSEISGGTMTRYDETTPQVWKIPLRDEIVPGNSIVAPKGGYLVPQQYAVAVAKHLLAHGIDFRVLTAPLRDRFGIVQRLEFYSAEELTRIVRRSARILGIDCDAAGAVEIARRLAHPGEIVLFSPGTSSFDMFTGYEARGEAFRRAWLGPVRRDAGLEPEGRQLVRCDLEASLDRLADVVRQNVDLKAIYQRLGL